MKQKRVLLEKDISYTHTLACTHMCTVTVSSPSQPGGAESSIVESFNDGHPHKGPGERERMKHLTSMYIRFFILVFSSDGLPRLRPNTSKLYA